METQPSEEQGGFEGQTVAEIMDDPDVSRIYANTFGLAFGSTDFAVLLHCNGKAVGVLNMSFSFAKTLANALLTGVDRVERATGNAVPEIPEMNQLLEEIGRKEQHDVEP